MGYKIGDWVYDKDEAFVICGIILWDQHTRRERDVYVDCYYIPHEISDCISASQSHIEAACKEMLESTE